MPFWFSLIVPLLLWVMLMVFIGVIITLLLAKGGGSQALIAEWSGKGNLWPLGALTVLMGSFPLIVTFIIWYRIHRREPWVPRLRLRLGAIIAGLSLGSLLFQGLFVLLPGEGVIPHATTDFLTQTLSFGTVESLLVNILAVAILSGIAEELFFRGALLSAMRRKVNVHISVAIVAAIFAMVHFSIPHTLYYMVFGVVAGYCFVLFRSVWAAVGLHIAYNCWVVVELWERNRVGGAENLRIGDGNGAGWLFLFLTVLVLVVFGWMNRSGSAPKENNNRQI